MKVAVCISGEPRQYEHTYQYLRKYFNAFVRNRKYKKDEDWSYDIFIHAWNSTSTARNYLKGSLTSGQDSNQHNVYDIDQLSNDLLEKYKPKRLLVESKDVLHNLVDYYGVKCDSSDIINSNYLAMSQHISAERAANLKSNRNIIAPSNDIIENSVTLNDYDMVVRTRFDVRLFASRCCLDTMWRYIQRFDAEEARERTPTGMTLFPSLTIREGRVACEFGHFWSNNTQFDMIYDSMFEKLHSSSTVDIYDSCHHHAFASHCLDLELSMREIRADTVENRDFMWVMPNVPPTCRTCLQYNNYYVEYSKDHSPKMKEITDQLKEQEERELRVQKEYDDNMKLVASGKLKDIWYNDEVYFVSPTDFHQMDNTDIAHLPINVTVKWCNLENKWVTM